MISIKELPEVLENCCKDLDQCLTLFKTYEIPPLDENLKSITNAIGEIVTMKMILEGYPKEVEPWEERCSFCRKKDSQVKHLIAGPVSMICNECIILAQETVTKIENEENAKNS
jgi:hypothetical protein